MSPEALTSPLLAQAGFRHAFFTRRGGVSTGPYESLSFSVAAGDDPAHVAENLRLAAAHLGVAEGKVLYLSQVHGREVVEVRAGDGFDDVLHREGDAVVSRAAGVAAGVRVADCVPVLVGDREGGGVVAIHAGWRGAVAGVVEAGVLALAQASGSPSSRFVAAVGPHISLASFEVGEEVAAELEAAGGPVVREPGKKPHADLRALVTAQLARLSVEVDQVEGCTVLDPARFFSFRRDGKRSGRHLAAIVPRV